ncbi:DUF1758 domain-containing protein [Trichonephila clavipes]|nr:DUF1758 domain-containing protein [Trichonephila clavipes]
MLSDQQGIYPPVLFSLRHPPVLFSLRLRFQAIYVHQQCYRVSLSQPAHYSERMCMKTEGQGERVPASLKNRWCPLAATNHQGKAGFKCSCYIKELKAFGSRINECDDNKSRIRVLKTQVLQYETRLTEIFNELSTHESDESFDIYMKYKDILFNWVVDLEEKSQVEEVNGSIHVKSSVVNLPKLEVPHFYGNGENWISFKELFKSSILDNKSISDLEKLQYLQASVRGDAAKLIRGFAITLDNLKNCWDIHCVVVSSSADTQANSVVTVSNNCTQSAKGHVSLSTALINVKSKHGEQITCRALIDNASQNSLISKQCADRLKLPLKHTNHKLVGVNETFAETSLYSTNFEFSSCVSSDKFQVKALLVSKVTSAMPNFPIKNHEWPYIKDLTLADPQRFILKMK